MKQYEMCELSFVGPVLTEQYASVDCTATLTCGDENVTVKGFYAGEGLYKVRFLPSRAGEYTYKVSGCVNAEGSVQVEPSDSHGMVRVQGQHFAFDDGTPYYPFGTTIYAMVHQSEELIAETLQTLSESPFNKIRICVFPKHYSYNANEPEYYAFEKKADGSWDVSRPCFAFWDHLEEKLCALYQLGIQVDLILFHPYDRWGFDALSQQENLTYLDYLLRRLSAYPFVWWSLANEYDLCATKSVADFEEIEEFVHAQDPYHHLLSVHNCLAPWDHCRPNITHVSYQTKGIAHVAQWIRDYDKPVMVDECCYEGNLPYTWGCITGQEMTARFWGTVVSGGYCTHGETFSNEEEIVWWSKGGKLIGENPARIAYLKDFVYSLPGAIEPVQQTFIGMDLTKDISMEEIPKEVRMFAESVARMTPVEREILFSGERICMGKIKDEVYLEYLERFCPAEIEMRLPEDRTYRIEIIDTWEMTRKTVLTGVNGKVMVPLPGKSYMAIAAFAE